jgi:hypothetical protein
MARSELALMDAHYRTTLRTADDTIGALMIWHRVVNWEPSSVFWKFMLVVRTRQCTHKMNFFIPDVECCCRATSQWDLRTDRMNIAGPTPYLSVHALVEHLVLYCRVGSAGGKDAVPMNNAPSHWLPHSSHLSCLKHPTPFLSCSQRPGDNFVEQ